MRIAVIGGGVAGITAAHMLQERHDVTLLEQNDYVGGHTHTIEIPGGPDAGMPVDTGFIVLNDRTYPTLNAFFRELGVGIQKSDMSFSYCDESLGFQYASSSLNALFAQRRNLLDAGYWGMLAEILWFNRAVSNALAGGRLDTLTLGQFLRRHRYSKRFREQYLFPMVAAIWSAPDLEVDRFPMITFARFFHNHGLLSVHSHPQWYFVEGGSHSYVRAFLEQFGGTVLTGSRPESIQRGQDGVQLGMKDGSSQSFDKVVIATHADEALNLLADPTDDERRLLGAWRYSVNQTVLHSDTSWMPSNRQAWASWNVFRAARSRTDAPVTLTYFMNRLQRLPTPRPYLVTLNPFKPISEKKIIARMAYTHPIFTFESLRTQPELHTLNGVRNTYYCGSYFRYGFHEDAARSGVQVAAALEGRHEF
jgi:predicted NAD/FAD-binding protein